MKFTAFMVVLLLLSMLSAAAKPEYIIHLSLFDKSVAQTESLKYRVYIQGAGACDEALVSLFPEGSVNISLQNGSIRRRTQLGDWEVVHPPETFKYACQTVGGEFQQGVARQGELTRFGVSDFNLSNQFSDEGFQELQFEGSLEPTPRSEGGNYELSAAFHCFRNATIYTFTDKKEYHVRTPFEQWELPLSVIAILISIAAFLKSGKKAEEVVNVKQSKAKK